MPQGSASWLDTAPIHRSIAPPAEDTFSLRTRDATGGDLQVILSDPRVEPALWWAADDQILYAYREDLASERSNQGVNSIRVDERTGKAIGQPQTVSNGQGRIGGLSATSDGKQLVLWRVNTQEQAFIARPDDQPRPRVSGSRLPSQGTSHATWSKEGVARTESVDEGSGDFA